MTIHQSISHRNQFCQSMPQPAFLFRNPLLRSSLFIIHCSLFILSVFLPIAAVAQVAPETWGGTDSTGWSRPLDIISVGVEFTASPGGGDFFEKYDDLGGTFEGIDPYIAPVLTGRMVLADALRFIVYGSYAHTSFVDPHGVARDTSAEMRGISASLVDEFSITVVPILAGLEYTPIRSQFTSYLGVLVGGSLATVDWTTTTREVTGTFYRPNVNVKGMSIGPAARIYTGVDLRFDRDFQSRGSIRGIYLEGAFTILPVTRDYFAEVRTQGRGVSGLPADDSATLYVGGLSLTLGINLQFLRL